MAARVAATECGVAACAAGGSVEAGETCCSLSVLYMYGGLFDRCGHPAVDKNRS